MPNVPNGVTFDGLHSYTDFGLWLAKQPDLGSPKPKLNLVEVPGMDGYLDMTEVNTGEVKFSNRTLVFTFSAMVDLADQATFKARIFNALHGKVIKKIILDNDAQWYYTGRASVVFPDTKSWKLRCVVTVDAEPYAMQLIPHIVTLRPSVYTIETHSVVLAENIYSDYHYGSAFFLGTKEFPAGVDTSFGFAQLKIGWTEASLWSGITKQIDVYDADGNVFVKRVDPVKTDYFMYVTFAELSQAGIDLSKIYRVNVSGVGSCTLDAEANLAYIPVDNARKPVAPGFVLYADVPVSVMINGVAYEIPVGTSQMEETVIHSGVNDVYVAANVAANISIFLMSLQEGKL